MSVFSLLIAHYNSGSFFAKCYDSILHQSDQTFEIVIVDDCSTDGSFEKLKTLTSQNPRVRIYKNDKNFGVGFTKRKCIELAQGHICGFLDPDDALQKQAIQKVLDVYQHNKNIIATYSKCYICDENLKIVKTFPNSKKTNTSLKTFFNINFEVSHFFTFKKEIYLQTEGMRSDLKVSEDMDLYLKLAEKGRFYFINEELYFYRVHKKGLSHDESKEALKMNSWDDVLRKTAERRKITKIAGKKINTIEYLPEIVFKKENTILKRILRKL